MRIEWTKKNKLTGSRENAKSALWKVKNGGYRSVKTVENLTALHPTCYVSTHAVFFGKGYLNPRCL